jgi:hypothetical protein
MHPYDKFENAHDMLEFFENFLAGKIKGTEKVDGYNLLASLNEQGRAVAVRNKNKAPLEDINKKFGLNHPAHNGFTAGWTAIKQKFESLSTEERIRFNLDKNFINMEILYGYIPNVVPYSQIINYIVFHGYVGNPGNNWMPVNQDEKLRQLAKKLGTVKITSPNVTFSGDPNNVKRTIKNLKSEWKFLGPIEITKKDVKRHLQKVASEWRKYPEVQALIEFSKQDKLHQEKKFELMKAATRKVGSAILTNMVSKLSDTGEVVPGYPGIEGIVTKQDGDLVKITGDFLDYAKPDIPALDVTKKLREVVQKDILGLNTTTLRGVENLEQLYDYVMQRKKKKYGYLLEDDLLTDEKNKIRKTIESSKEDVKNVVKIIQSKGRAFDIKNLLIQTFMIINIEKQLGDLVAYCDLITLYGKELYNLK